MLSLSLNQLEEGDLEEQGVVGVSIHCAYYDQEAQKRRVILVGPECVCQMIQPGVKEGTRRLEESYWQGDFHRVVHIMCAMYIRVCHRRIQGIFDTNEQEILFEM